MIGFELGGIKFRQVESERVPARSADDEFIIAKDDATLRFYESLRPHVPKTIMEIGMFEGGSLVYFDKLYKPTKIVGLDRRVKPITALEAYRKTRPHIETYYARFQDKAGVTHAARQNFPKGLDLVVDDASHLYHETRATFEMLFPMLRLGGHYVIENWRGAKWQRKGGEEAEVLSLADRWVHELVAKVGWAPALESITLSGQCACIRKGPGVYDPAKIAAPAIAPDSDSGASQAPTPA